VYTTRHTAYFFCLAVLLTVFHPTCGFAERTNPAINRAIRLPAEASPVNSAHFVDVTRADGVFVKEPIIAGDTYSEGIATENSLRIKAILTSPAIGKYCRIHFPAGSYYFNGAAPEWGASIQTTAKNQSFTGAGINATRIIQKSTSVPASIKVSHSNCTVENLSILSADYQLKYNRDWDEHPHQAAILLEARKTNPPWHTDPQILNVNINATGNNIIIDGFYRPFKAGIKCIGPWLNIYVQSMFILHVHDAIYINQGNVIAGPAKFIDVNHYSTAPTDEPHVWNTFFKSEGHFMEQVELIHCTYIGSQFIFMDGTKLSEGDDNFTNPPTNPVYNMVVDHCYINALWQALPSDDPKWSSVYFNLPPKPGGVAPGYGSELYSKKIVFTYNWCAGKTPRDGAFFYVEGNLKGLTIHGNDFASGGGDRCIYVRASQPLINSDVAVKDVEITHNYINDFRNPIVIGGGRNSDTNWVEGVMIVDNQTFYLPVCEKIQQTSFSLNRARRITINGNKLAPTGGSSLVLHHCEDVTMNGNIFQGFAEKGKAAIQLINSTNVSLTGNIIRRFQNGIDLRSVESATLNGNNLVQCGTALLLRNTVSTAVSANVIGESDTSLSLHDLQDVSILGNVITRSGRRVVGGKNRKLELQKELNSRSKKTK